MDIFNEALPFRWKCPVCAHAAVITESSIDRKSLSLHASKDSTTVVVRAVVVECPNSDCEEQSVRVGAYWARYQMIHGTATAIPTAPIGIGQFAFAPTSVAPLSETVPQSVRSDYDEAYLIRTLSPKASATLSRRALQGMIRDRWGVVKRTLDGELKAIEEYCEPELYQALMGLKAIGNIGAHPEKDADVIIDIEDGEAEELLQLLKYLDEEWYVAREKRKKRLSSIEAMAGEKAATRSADRQTEA